MADLRHFLPTSVLRQLADEGYRIVKLEEYQPDLVAGIEGDEYMAQALSQNERWKLANDHMLAQLRERDAANRADPAWRRANLCASAQELLMLLGRCPELFEGLLPIDDEVRRKLRDLVLER